MYIRIKEYEYDCNRSVNALPAMILDTKYNQPGHKAQTGNFTFI